LVKYAGVPLKSFICPDDAGATEFNPTQAGALARRPIDLWDFGSEPFKHCSYSYHMPFGLYALTTSNEPNMAVAADRNPWIVSPSGERKDMRSSFNPDGDRTAIKTGNSMVHQEEGQNVSFVDGHVTFEDHSFCGIKDDNIYTYWDGGDIRRGGVPITGASEAKDRTDSFLVNEPGTPKPKTIVKQPKEVSSADLKQTVVLPTLDCPIPEHKNVIWCATFQVAWDKFKNDIIGEPVQLIGAEELANRLNKGSFEPQDIEPKSFYASAGFVKDGIIEQIQKEMARRFPSESKPVFDERYRALPLASVAYSFLSVGVEFTFPFYVHEGAFDFTASDGTRTGVTAFSTESDAPDPNCGRLHEQVEILYYKYGTSPSAPEFAVDLCKHTKPYQVVLVRVPQRVPLGEALKTIEQNISDFKNDPHYEVLRELRRIDRLIVPDILYKLTHHFKELEWKNLANPKWRAREYFIFEARQMVDFSLSRTGVILKSEARIGGAGGMGPPDVEQPRYLYFNKPFLIYVKKRGADYSPFFVMWVDNAELMSEF
jgi:prepilin-type processing-associated H-X9-DG protein